MDNQQERLIWLAGLIDGEGYLGINKTRRDNRFSGYQMTPRLIIVNTNQDVLQVVTQTLDEYGLAYYVGWRKPGVYKARYWKWALEVSGVKRLSRFLPVVLPNLVCKKPQAELLLAYCQDRLSRTTERFNNKGLAKYSEQDLQVWEAIKALNQNPQRTYAEPHKGRYVPSTSEI